MAKLIVRFEDKVIAEYLLDKDIIRIGRLSDNDISLEDTSVSRKHAQVEKIGDHYLIKDLGSTNGIFFQGQKVNSIELKNRDEIGLGKYKLTFFEEVEEQEEKTFIREFPVEEETFVKDEYAHIPKEPIGEVEKRANLTIIKGLNLGEKILLDKTKIEIGRAKDNDIILDDQLASRHHTLILFDNNQFTIRDLGSVNGVKVNGELVSEKILANGDEIKIGNTIFRFTSKVQAFSLAKILRPTPPVERPGVEPALTKTKRIISPKIILVGTSLGLLLLVLFLANPKKESLKKESTSTVSKSSQESFQEQKYSFPKKKGYKEIIAARRHIRASEEEKRKAEKLFEKGKQFYKEREVGKAVQLWEKALEIHPHFKEVQEMIEKEVETHFNRGKRFYLERKFYQYSSGKIIDAIAEWEIVLLLNPGHKEALEKINKAKKDLSKAVEQHYRLGNRYYKNHLYTLAITEYEMVAKLTSPDDPFYREMRLKALQNMKEAKEKVKYR